MDIAYYISDLLGQQGELSVPHLGYFAQIRKPAFYDDVAKKFYPPQYVVQFDPQVIDGDDSLAEYITGLKKISIASSKYFIEKYIVSLKNQVVIEDIPFADLGKFSSDGTKLSFQPGIKTNAPAFFAFPPINVNKIGDDSPPGKLNKHDQFSIPAPEPVSEFNYIPQQLYVPETAPTPAPTPEPTYVSNPLYAPEPVYTPPVRTPEPVYSRPEPVHEEVVEEEEITPHMNIWTIVLVTITVLAIVFVVLYKLKPGPFKEWFGGKQETSASPAAPIIKPESTTPDTTAIKDALVHTDTVTPHDNTEPVKTAPAITAPASTPAEQPVTTATASGAPSDMPAVIPKGLWLIYSGTFPIRSLADSRIAELKTMGYTQARLLREDVKVGNNYKVILGAYKTKAEAEDKGKELLMAHKIDIFIERY